MSGNRLGRERRLPTVSSSHGAHVALEVSPSHGAHVTLRVSPSHGAHVALGVSPSHGVHVPLRAAEGKEDFVLLSCAFPSPSSGNHNLQIFLKFNNSLQRFLWQQVLEISEAPRRPESETEGFKAGSWGPDQA